MDRQVDETGNGESVQEKDQDDASSSGADEVDDQLVNKDGANSELLAGLRSGKLSEWEARRYGSMAARLLRDVKITWIVRFRSMSWIWHLLVIDV